MRLNAIMLAAAVAAAAALLAWVAISGPGPGPAIGSVPEKGITPGAAPREGSVAHAGLTQGAEPLGTEASGQAGQREAVVSVAGSPIGTRVLTGEVAGGAGRVKVRVFWSVGDRFEEDADQEPIELARAGRFALALRDEDLLVHERVAIVAISDRTVPSTAEVATADVLSSSAARRIGTIVLDAGVTLGGQTMTKSGRAVADVGLRALRKPPFVRTDGSELFFCVSDASGRFSFPFPLPLGPTILQVSRAGIAADYPKLESLVLSDSLSEHVVYVVEAHCVQGWVRKNGGPGNGARVFLGSIETSPKRIRGHEDTADVGGHFAIYADEDTLRQARVGIENPGNRGDYLWGSPVELLEADHSLSIETGSVLLTVQERSGEAQTRYAYELQRVGASVAAPARTVYAMDGQLLIDDLLVGDYSASVTPIESADGTLLPAKVTFVVKPQCQTGVSVTLESGSRLTLDVKTRQGVPVEGTRVWALDTECSVWETPPRFRSVGTTDAQGRCDLVVPTGRYYVLGRGRHVPFLLPAIDAVSKHVTTDVFVSEGASVSLVTEPPLSREAGECVLVKRSDAACIVPSDSPAGDGVFHWFGMPLGEWDVRLYRLGRLVTQVDALEHLRLVEEGRHGVRIRLHGVNPRPIRVHATVGNAPLIRANISMFRVGDLLRGDTAYCGATDDAGDALIACPTGRFRIASYDGREGRWLYSPDAISIDDTMTTLDTSLGAFPLAAVIVDATGQEVCSTRLEIHGGDWGVEPVVTDAAGRVELKDGPCCEFRFRDVVRGRASGVLQPTPSGSGQLRLTLLDAR